ncbi:RagB/SusD family nutrient uptake outer membrane protein [Filimonas effusa]|uniref:RagB/SusD family nutrient uptake outer membrane protein n=2 Tax=Filimonas effusa TaxID=2508721 RepID=A0A4Q1D605_9BACT|nr:RagB/SusD family nutrient uptake outer membrane protein [Filimonas effusa]
MNKLFLILTGAAAVVSTGCTKLDVDAESELTPSTFPKSEAAYIAASGPVYRKLSTSDFSTGYWWNVELSTDEAIIPTRGSGYYDGGKYIALHKHSWNAEDPTIKGTWSWGYSAISECNRILDLFSKAENSDLKNTSIAELRAMRSLFYFYMMDLFGNIPITSFGTAELPKQSTRKEVFDYIEKELLAVIPNLPAPSTVGQANYGRPTRWMAYALLQKLYLNAEYYTGANKYVASVEYADKLLNESSLQLVANYADLFSPTNGANSETIMAAIFDPVEAKGNHLTRYSLHSTLRNKYKLPYSPSNAMCTVPEFYNLFKLAGDVRNSTWLAGKQFDNDGKAIMNGSAQLDLTPEIVLTDAATMNVGTEVGGISRGARSIKFFPDPNSSTDRYQGNDIPILRLADVYLMKAEAILRGAAATSVKGEMQTPDVLVRKIRSRAGVTTPVSGVTLDQLLDERGRELAWECWRRNDLIRFGKYEGKWGFKEGGESVDRRLFPIPSTERVLNPNLNQNKGYN